MWYSRPVLFVADVECSVDFYVRQLSFAEAWRHAEGGKLLVAQVDRDGCEIILSCQWPQKNGKGMLFISLDADLYAALPNELSGAGVAFTHGNWGYPVVIVDDPDGNQLFFPDPNRT
jgi:catechol 2,3-dioxygenase-like lactoylglutathione lyase family enzyme